MQRIHGASIELNCGIVAETAVAADSEALPQRQPESPSHRADKLAFASAFRESENKVADQLRRLEGAYGVEHATAHRRFSPFRLTRAYVECSDRLCRTLTDAFSTPYAQHEHEHEHELTTKQVAWTSVKQCRTL
jgi:hypothetical protein